MNESSEQIGKSAASPPSGDKSKSRETLWDPGPVGAGGGPSTGMTMPQLKTNYQTICRMGAVLYPVAFQFARELGRGRQGMVFLGLRQGSRGCITEHAIKLLDPAIYRSVEEYWTDMGRIGLQISRLQRLRSPHIVSSHSYDETYGIGYVQMEAIEGMDLRHFLVRKTLDSIRPRCTSREWSKFTTAIFNIRDGVLRVQPGVVVHILRGAVRGLECLHGVNFLHADVKPANLMVDRLGYAQLVDLGRAVVVGERPAFLPGTPMYMAPEVHRREVAGVQADIYSLGLVGLEMLRGARLTDREDVSEEELMQIKLGLPAILPDILPKNVSANQDLVAILRKFLDPDPARRYHSATDAEAGSDGLLKIEKQLVRAGLDTEYERDLADYLEKFVDERTGRMELSPTSAA